MKNKFVLLLAIIAISFMGACSDDDNMNTPEPITPEVPTPEESIPETYRLPVIFHILYSDANSKTENVPSEIIYDLINRSNNMLKNTTTSINMNVELIAATTDPSGKALSEKGIHRVLRSDADKISAEEFMESKETKNVELVWDPNNYVNIFIYSFTEESTTGIAHLPYTPTSNSLEGLHVTDYYYSKPMNNTWGISLNNLFFYTLNDEKTAYIYDNEAYNTLTHELGHYLGLHHTFSEEDCSETDYCNDTPNYNRDEYTTWLYDLAENNPDELTWTNAVKRTACDGVSFVSHNIMDYDFSYFDQYTRDQRTRTRHVLENSSLIPGPKQPRTSTRSTTSEEEPPIIFVRCSKLHIR